VKSDSKEEANLTRDDFSCGVNGLDNWRVDPGQDPSEDPGTIPISWQRGIGA